MNVLFGGNYDFSSEEHVWHCFNKFLILSNLSISRNSLIYLKSGDEFYFHLISKKDMKILFNLNFYTYRNRGELKRSLAFNILDSPSSKLVIRIFLKVLRDFNIKTEIPVLFSGFDHLFFMEALYLDLGVRESNDMKLIGIETNYDYIII